MAFIFLLLFGFCLVPSFSFAWGPLTHMYLGNEIFSYGPLIPAGIFALIRKYRQDFLYGNLMADSIIGKKYLPDDKCSHSWDVALRLLGHAETDPEKAFAYGYLSHLAADTVAHEILTEDMRNMEHTWAELKADSMIKKTFWVQSVTFSRAVQKRNDLVHGKLPRPLPLFLQDEQAHLQERCLPLIPEQETEAYPGPGPSAQAPFRVHRADPRTLRERRRSVGPPEKPSLICPFVTNQNRANNCR